MRAVGGTSINKVHNKEQCLFACIKDVSNKTQVSLCNGQSPSQCPYRVQNGFCGGAADTESILHTVWTLARIFVLLKILIYPKIHPIM